MARLTTAASKVFTGVDNAAAHMAPALERRRAFAPVGASAFNMGAPAPAARHG